MPSRARGAPLTHVEFEIEAPDGERDRLVAELGSLGTLGLIEEERALRAFFSAGSEPALVLALSDAARGIVVRGPLEVPPEDWELRWREGLAPRCVAGLWVRPSWCPSEGLPELVIDPKQAFGSGEHASTRGALALLREALRPGDALLDVGTGSGILGLAALRWGARRVLGIDFDADACVNALENAERNALPLALLRSTPEALRPGVRFDVVVANLLASELDAALEAIARIATRELVLAGYLGAEADRWDARLRERGWRRARETREHVSGDAWVASRWTPSASSADPAG